MKTSPVKIPTIFLSLGLLLCSLFLSSSGNAQTKYQSAGGVKIIIEGTSNIHDWDMKSDKGTCTGVFDISNAGLLTGMSVLNFSVPAESPKSEHTSMDNNTYKALHTKKYSSINFTAASATIKSDGSGYI